ncbi:MAG TPA: tRNA 2-thiouridine(34) synthase MnmA [Treponemataceae bacterium]|nr:tRNA 2-thiouridine(34) synthase MnmA [Treponemataceae bacterium]
MAKILVAMSGGVDSSVAAKLLIDQGHEVAGATMKLFSNEDIVLCDDATRTCCALSDVEDARRVADKLGIEHFVYNFRDLFAEKVIGHFVDSYLEGKTPNPCIDCNRWLKFDKLIERATLLGFDAVATGHYSIITREPATGRYVLRRGVDRSKDQSYVLYSLTQAQLARTLFPLGELDKATVRKIAEEAGLVNARKPDSQDICFVPGGDYPAFIDKAAPGRVIPGDFIDLAGKVIGKHKGVAHYTIGQRRGIAAAFGKPMYVVAKNATDNTVTLGEDKDLMSTSLVANDVNLISVERLDGPMNVTVKIRYNQNEQEATVTPLADGEIRVDFAQPQRAVTEGQAVVLYSGDAVVGGGTIVSKS